MILASACIILGQTHCSEVVKPDSAENESMKGVGPPVPAEKLEKLFQVKELSEVKAKSVKQYTIHRQLKTESSDADVTRFIQQYNHVTVDFNTAIDMITWQIDQPSATFRSRLDERLAKIEQESQHLDAIYKNIPADRSILAPAIDAAIETATKLYIAWNDIHEESRRREMEKLKKSLNERKMKAYAEL
jgi:hypothetical protein